MHLNEFKINLELLLIEIIYRKILNVFLSKMFDIKLQEVYLS